MDRFSYRGVAVDIPGEIRLDRYAAEQVKILSRSQIKSRILEARVNGRSVKLSRLIRAGDLLELSWLTPPEENLVPEDIPLDILYEDERTVVINKPAGMVVHPGAGNHSGTLANALLWRRLVLGKTERGPGPANRTGIVHRLDKDTSGVMIAAYDDGALAFLASQFKARKVEKRYAALVRGTPREKQGLIHRGILRDPGDRKRFTAAADPPGSGGRVKPALTRYRLIRSWGDYSLLLLRPKTGRTHQIRVHLRFLGHPILGDPLYAPRDRGFPHASLMLHASSLTLALPDGAGPCRFRAPLPDRFKTIITSLKRA
ncbi:MAG: RluA family pseudouridine synthase [Treponema sp.]|jgi:23S rRNA pseudouridine1911/1915/1917 synthase|nr:RluA family pseudouridine synthase [Treponema sp.]